MSSLENRIREGRLGKSLTGVLSQAVNSSNSVNSLLTVRASYDTKREAELVSHENGQKGMKFSSPLQRIDERYRLRAEEIARKYGRKTFNDVLDVLFFCYDEMEEIARMLGCPLHQAPQKVKELIPLTPVDKLSKKLTELLDELGIRGSKRKEMEPLLYSLLFKVLIQDKVAELRRVLAVFAHDD